MTSDSLIVQKVVFIHRYGDSEIFIVLCRFARRCWCSEAEKLQVLRELTGFDNPAELFDALDTNETGEIGIKGWHGEGSQLGGIWMIWWVLEWLRYK